MLTFNEKWQKASCAVVYFDARARLNILYAGKETRIVVDGVAYAPHLPIDVKAWGVDWYGFSVYKTWGPHMAALYGSHAAFEELKVHSCAFSSTLLS